MHRRVLSRRTEAGESTALETDVVRFFAIVGLTLMVIFALVHSLPYEGSEAAAEVELRPPEQPPAADVVAVPREELDRLSRSEAELEQVEQLLAEEIATRDSLEQELGSLQQRVRGVTGELSATRQELDRARAALSKLESQDVAEDRRYRAEIESLREQVDTLEAALRQAARKVAEAAPPPVEPEAPPEVATPEPPTVESFLEPPDSLVLRFQDDQVYLDLLGRDRIRSYVYIAELDLTYRVLYESHYELRFSLVYQIDDGALYEIQDGMVPLILRNETRRFDLRLSLRNDLDYLVVLSDRIHAQVAKLEAAGKVGYYDILANEQIVPAVVP